MKQMGITLKEYLDRTRYDTGITTDEMMKGISIIQLEVIKNMRDDMLVDFFKALMEESKK